MSATPEPVTPAEPREPSRGRYPCDLIAAADGKWLRIHAGHNVPLDVLQADYQRAHASPAGAVYEEWLRFAPRVKWCSRQGAPCDSDGVWHPHWFASSPKHGQPFTLVAGEAS